MKQRPTTIEAFHANFEGLFTEFGRKQALNFQPKPSDIIISPYSKSGTTWLQQIVHGLRTRGDMDFDDISRVVPWLEASHDLGIDIHTQQRALPRAFKSHLDWHDVPKGGRYIVSVRNPKDVLVSSYRFMEGWFFEPGAFSITEYALADFLAPREGAGYWNHLLSWWPQRERPDVLLLSFEAMKADLPQVVRRVAEFIGVELDDDLYTLVVEQSSFEFMRAHGDRFDDVLMRERSELICQLPSNSDSSKVRAGKVGSHMHELTDALRQRLDDMWRQTITPTLGFESYEALEQELAAFGRNHSQP